MKILVVTVAMIGFLVSLASAQVPVDPYTRKDGTVVPFHYRSSPDGNPYNNYSFPGNTNPYTGRVAPGKPDSYLQRNRTPDGLGGGNSNRGLGGNDYGSGRR